MQISHQGRVHIFHSVVCTQVCENECDMCVCVCVCVCFEFGEPV
jgi:hypothetical protein